MKCKNCNEKDAIKYSKYSNGEFCSRECARSYSTKNDKVKIKICQCISCGKKIEVNKRSDPKRIKCEICKKKIKIKYRGKKEKVYCKNCGKEFECLSIKVRIGKGIFCSRLCHFDFLNKNSQTEKEQKYYNILYQKKFKYNLSEDKYLELMKIKHCMICGDKLNVKCIDHNHENNKVRGILCNNCNTGIGFLKDSIKILKNAIKYIEDDGKYLNLNNMVSYSADPDKIENCNWY